MFGCEPSGLLPPSHKKSNLVLDVIYLMIMNLDIPLSRFIVLICHIASSIRFVFFGTEGVEVRAFS